jgi:hypothetical protein
MTPVEAYESMTAEQQRQFNRESGLRQTLAFMTKRSRAA